MRKINIFKGSITISFVILFLLSFSLDVFSAVHWTENFDTQTSSSYVTGIITINGRDWTTSTAGNFAYANTNMGSYAFTINDDNAGAHITTPSVNTCGNVSFKYAFINGLGTNVFVLQKSTNGTDWSDLDTHTLGDAANLSYVDYSYDVNDASATVYIRILSDNQNAHLFIEDFSISDYSSSGQNPPTALSIDTVTSDKLNITWTKPSGTYATDWDGVVVFMRGGAANDASVASSDGIDYTGSTSDSTAGTASNNSWCVANQTTDADGDITVSGLTEGSTYYVIAYTYKIVGGDDNDDTWSDASSEINDVAAIQEVADLTATPQSKAMGLTWTNPIGVVTDWWDKVIILAKQGSSVDGTPSGAPATYTADTAFGLGYEVGTGNYVVYNGTGTDVTVGNLVNGTVYYFKVFVYYEDAGAAHDYSAGNAVNSIPHGLVINEFQADPDAVLGDANGDGTPSTTQDEFVEIVNNSNLPLDIHNWELHDAIGLKHTFDTIIPGYGAIVIFGGGTPTGIFGGSIVKTASSGGLGLNNTGDNIIIKNSSGTSVLSYTYGSEGGDNQSVTRDPDITGGFVKHSTTAGALLFSPGTKNDGTSKFLYQSTGSGNWATVVGATGAGTNVLITALSTVTVPAAKATEECNDLTVQAGANLQVDGTLNVNGDLLIESNATGTGSVIDAGTLAVTGSTTTQLYLGTNSTTDNWRYISAPVSGASSAVVDAVTNKLYYWDESSDIWTQISNNATALNIYQGYAVSSSVARTIEFTGTLTTGSQGSNNNLSKDNVGYNLVGNPYPSAIDWGSENFPTTGLTQTNIETTIWFRSSGSFGTYNWSGDGTPANGGQQYIPVMQGFWVRVSTNPGGIEFTNDVRVHNTQAFYKQDKAEENIFRIVAEKEGFTDEAVIGFYNNASDGFENYDSEKMFSNDDNYPQIYTEIEEHLLVINGLSPFTEDKSIQLGFRAQQEGTYSLVASNIDDFNSNISVYLEDNLSNDIINLRDVSEYEFTSEIVNSLDRFVLHFIKSGTNSVEKIREKVRIYTYQNSVFIQNADNGTIEVYNVLGKLVTKENINNDFGSITVNAVTGYYFVKVVTNGNVYTKKVYIK